MNEFIYLNKEQTDILGWTDKTDDNDIIIINSDGNIIERRPMMGMFPQEDGSYISKSVRYEVCNNGWQFKSK